MGDKVFVRVAPYKHIVIFGRKGKLASRFMRAFEILKHVGFEVKVGHVG